MLSNLTVISNNWYQWRKRLRIGEIDWLIKKLTPQVIDWLIEESRKHPNQIKNMFIYLCWEIMTIISKYCLSKKQNILVFSIFFECAYNYKNEV